MAGRASRGGEGRKDALRQDLPRPLVLPSRRDRSLLVHHPHPDRHLLVAVLRAVVVRGHLRGRLQASSRPVDVRCVRVDGQPVVRGQKRSRHPPDAPLGGGRLRRLDRCPHVPRVLHRRVPQAPRAELDRRRDPAHACDRERLPRLLPSRRPGVRHWNPHRVLDHLVDPACRDVSRVVRVRGEFPRRRHDNSEILHIARPRDSPFDLRVYSPRTSVFSSIRSTRSSPGRDERRRTSSAHPCTRTSS